MSPDTRQQARRQICDRRRLVARSDARRAAHALTERIARSPAWRASRRIAFYWPMNGEIDVTLLLARAVASGRTAYLPVLDVTRRRLRFARYRPDAPARRNFFRILEPVPGARLYLPAARLDLVLTPLVAFDALGNRLGMGGGYYDRTFAFLLGRTWRRPRLLGVGFEFQRLDMIDAQSWDVPLWGIETERASYRPAT